VLHTENQLLSVHGTQMHSAPFRHVNQPLAMLFMALWGFLGIQIDLTVTGCPRCFFSALIDSCLGIRRIPSKSNKDPYANLNMLYGMHFNTNLFCSLKSSSPPSTWIPPVRLRSFTYEVSMVTMKSKIYIPWLDEDILLIPVVQPLQML